MNRQYKYKFSVVVPIYNVEEYLEETIKSVIKQTIGFKKNIQLILVNDGSPDNSEEICLKYKEKYPDNVVYVKQKNAGVSAARNKGIEYAEGEFINFLDSDDKWDKNAYKKINEFFNANKGLNIVVGRMKFFEASTAYHPLDYKFDDETRVINIFEEPMCLHLHITSSFIKTDIAKKYKFDKKLRYGEDAKYVEEIILDSEKYGIVKEAVHYYRKRLSGTSAIQNQSKNIDYYTEMPKRFYEHIIKKSNKNYGKVIKYVQNLLIYELQWKIKQTIPSDIDKKIANEYEQKLLNFLNYIDDDVVLSQKNIVSEYKLKLLSLKHSKDIRAKLKYKNHKLYYSDTFIMDLINESRLNLRTINFNKKSITIIGLFNIYLSTKDFNLYYVVDSKRYKIKLEETIINKKKLFNNTFKSDYGFEIEIPYNFKRIHFEVQYKKNEYCKLFINFKMNTKLNNILKSYHIENDKIFYCHKNSIRVKENNFKSRLKLRLRFIKQLVFTYKNFEVIFYRALYYILKKAKKKDIWLISDRPPVANDNGYAFFKYVNSINLNNIDAYFIITKNSKDLKKVKNTGKYIIYNSLKYKIYFLLSDMIISSQADQWTTNAFSKYDRYYRDLYNFNFVFLQHGITKDDLSEWLNKYDKKIDLFVTTAAREYDSIIDNKNYGFDKNIIKLCGFPRYDLLNQENEKKQIIIMPTWRKNLSKSFNFKTGLRNENLEFKNSEYYKFYNELINDKRLLKVMKEHGYTGLFVSHPVLFANSNDFESNDIIKVATEMVDYSELFNTSKLLISDFSSVPFDFAYLKKPVIYTQFDKETFFQQHSYDEGYFSYEKDGFGPVLYNYEDTINEIIKYIENDCKIESKYNRRIESFYKFTDKNNCKRVLEEIMKKDL